MIGPGWLPRYLPSKGGRPRKHTLAYTHLRRRSRSRGNRGAIRAAPVNNEIVLFDYRQTEFPIATARPRQLRARAIALAASLQRWAADRWAWLRPRTVPCAVAALGMVAVLYSADYLAHHHEEVPAATHVHIDLGR